jgi:hypothetical protein
MDLRSRLHGVAPISGRQFAWFRIAFGLYLAVHFAHLLPWGRELFSREGVLADPRLNPTYGILPNVLARWDTPGAVTAFLAVMVVLSLLLALGVARRAAAVALWYGWACLFNRNVLISNPSIAYVGLLLLLTALVPTKEPYRLGGRRSEEDEFYFPAGVFHAAWILMAVGYTFSGALKLASPSWVDGTAFWHVVNNPLARDSWLRDIVLTLPMWVFRGLSWGALALVAALAFPVIGYGLWQQLSGGDPSFVGETIGRTQLDLWSRAYHAFHDSRPAYDASQFLWLSGNAETTPPSTRFVV